MIVGGTKGRFEEEGNYVLIDSSGESDMSLQEIALRGLLFVKRGLKGFER